jgi:hypothetical protein
MLFNRLLLMHHLNFRYVFLCEKATMTILADILGSGMERML